MIYFHSRRSVFSSLFGESTQDFIHTTLSPKKERGRQSKLNMLISPVVKKDRLIKEEEMVDKIKNESEIFEHNHEQEQNIVSLEATPVPFFEAQDSRSNWETQDEQDIFQEDVTFFEENPSHEEANDVRDFSQNQISLSFSWSLMNQLKQMSKNEGVPVEDLLTELVAEGVAKRVFEEQTRPAPSHLMTRTGYVHTDGTHAAPQPQLSHHSIINRQQNNIPQNRSKFNFQQRNSQYHQNRNNPNINNRNNYQQQSNNNSRQQNNNQNNFRNQYHNSQQKFHNSRQNYQNQRFYEDQTQTTNHSYKQPRETNKR